MTARVAQESLLLERVFEAPIQRVFDAWTRPEMLAAWFGPEGFKVLSADCDLSIGGSYDITILSPDNLQIRHFGEYVDIASPHRLVFTWILQD
ncbi:MAG: hypothetical protein ACI8P9_004740 [Parasphingorhabdus sp.]|jgi:uncharacterized protein YndB with AHSA1/START domain